MSKCVCDKCAPKKESAPYASRKAMRRIIVLPPKDEVERLRYDTTTNLLNKINEQDMEIVALKAENERLKAKLASLGQVGLPGW